MKKTVVGIALMAGIVSTPILADEPLNVAGSVPLFCLDDGGVYQPFERTNLDRLKSSFDRQFGWQGTLYATSKSKGYLVFSQSGETNSTERILYDVAVRNEGIALIKMHVRLTGKVEDLSGSSMCWQTFAIVNE